MENNADSPGGAKPPKSRLRQVRLLLWVLVGLAVLGAAAILLLRRDPADPPPPQTTSLQASFGGPFTLTGGDGKSFSSSRLAGKPYAIFFGFTRCGDVCPTTLGRLVKLRNAAGGADAFNIVFVTIDPENDGPKEVGQYADLFGSPIIGLTGTPEQIAQVKRQYGIYAEPNPAAEGHGNMINHTSTVLLFGADGTLKSTISGQEPDAAALDKIKQLT
jgi:protein SCO1/2